MHLPQAAIDKFRQHYELAESARSIPQGFTVVELGPGDSVFSLAIARGWGARMTYAVDAGSFAIRELPAYQQLAEALRSQGRPCPDITGAADFEDLLGRLNAVYLTEGTKSLSRIASSSVDFIWSCVVLEHVHRAEFPLLARELRRILRPSGVMAHSIDLRDHLGGGLNNLRVSTERWESPFFRDAGFYTNRLGFRDITHIFEKAGFQWKTARIDRWPKVPIARSCMQPEFRGRSDEELRIAGFQLILWPKPNARTHGDD
jgi:SAM-dependent methyltransferase